MADIKETDVLDLFSQISAIKNSDEFLLISKSQDGSVRATKITAELVRAYLNKGFEVTIGSDGYLYIGGVKTETEAAALQMIEQTDTTVTIKPNVLNVWGAVSSLTIGFESGSAGRVNEYMIQFSCPENSATILNLPSSVRWVDGALEPEAGYTYQISVVNNLAVYAEWEAANT